MAKQSEAKQAEMFKRRLGSLGATFKKAQEEAKSRARNEAAVPDGRYIVKVKEAELTVSQVTDRLQIHWQWEVQEGEHAGVMLHSWDGIETEMNLTFLCRTLDRLGYDIDEVDITSLDEILSDIKETEPTVRIRVRTKEEFTNIFVEKLLEAEEADEEEEEETGEEEEEEAGLEVGSAVTWEKNGDTITGTVTEIGEDIVKVKRDDTGKIAKVAPDALSLVGADEEEAEEEEEEEEAEDEDGAEAPFAEGDLVQYQLGERTIKGTVIECWDDMVRIQLPDGANVKKKQSAVTKVADTAPCEVGDQISWQYKNKTLTGPVTAILEDKLAVHAKRDDNGKTTLVPWADLTVIPASDDEEEEEEEDSEEEEDAVELQVGMQVSFVKGEDTIEGTVTKINDDDETVKVKRADTGKVATVKVADLTLLDGNELDGEEEDEE